MANNKKSGGDSVKNLIKSFEDFKKVVSKEVNIKIGETEDGKPILNTYTVHAITPKRLAEIRGNFKNAKPSYPMASKDSEGVDREIPKTHIDKYTLDTEAWKLTEHCYLVLAGWVEPEKIEIEGKTDQEQAEYLFRNAGVAGHLQILASAVEEVSALTSADVNFM